jgi:HPt (histidine-containing phosphotransfer) domain-containing protein
MDAYLAKPIQAGELFAALAELFPPEQAAAATPDPIDEQQAADTGVWDSRLALANAGGDADLQRELVELFLEETPGLLEKLGDAAMARNAAAATRLAHGIKGSAATIGAMTAREAAQRLEQSGVAADWQSFDIHLPALRQAVEQLTAALYEMRVDKLPAGGRRCSAAPSRS